MTALSTRAVTRTTLLWNCLGWATSLHKSVSVGLVCARAKHDRDPSTMRATRCERFTGLLSPTPSTDVIRPYHSNCEFFRLASHRHVRTMSVIAIFHYGYNQGRTERFSSLDWRAINSCFGSLPATHSDRATHPSTYQRARMMCGTGSVRNSNPDDSDVLTHRQGEEKQRTCRRYRQA